MAIDHTGAKAFSIGMAYAAFRYCLGGTDKRFTIRECIRWLELLGESDGGSPSKSPTND